MASLVAALGLPSKLKASPYEQKNALFVSRRRSKKKNQSFAPVIFLFFFLFLFRPSLKRKKKFRNFVLINLWVCMDQVARLFGPAIFEASKLKVLFLGVDEEKHPGKLPRTYTLTHSDITSKLTLAISQTINNSQVIL